MSITGKQLLLSKFEDRSARVAVLGLGYVGLPLAVAFAQAGFKVIGIDLDERKIEALKKGESYIQDVTSDDISRLIQSGFLMATSDFSVLQNADTVSICVPTPLRKTGDPDLSYIISATDTLSKYMHPNMVVTLESTTYPGTTREILLQKLGTDQGLKAGDNLFLAFSPERVDPGRKDFTTLNTPKVIGGITPDCSLLAAALYGKALQIVVPVSSAEVAEMTKLLENTFRMINIGLVNEMAMMCEKLGVDVWEVIDAAATKPFGFMKFTPGPGLGGHCIPIDPLYLSWKLRALNYTARFIELASEINTGMPRYVVGKVQDALNDQAKPLKGSRLLVLGVAYKPDIDDIRESPALDVIGLLQQKGAEVVFHDPYITSLRHEGLEMDSVPDLMEAVRQADCMIIITNHSSYDYPTLLQYSRLIVDTRNAIGIIGRSDPRVVRL